MNAAYRAIVRSPWLVVAVVAAATVVLGLGALRLRVDSSVTTLLPRGDPAKQRYDEVVERFGADEVDIIGVIADDALAPATLEKIRLLTTRAAAIPGVGSVISLTNVRDPIADVLNPPLLIPAIPKTPAAREALRARIKDNPLFAGNLIAHDSRGAAVNVFLASDVHDDASARRVDAALEALVAEVGASGPERLVLTGISHLKVNALALMRRDLAALTPASLAFVVLVLFFSFRTRRGVMLPLLCLMTGVIWTMGIMGWLGEPISLGTLVLPSLLIVIGSSYATHVVSRYYLELETPTTPGEPVYGALQQAGLPVFVSALTTVIGFSALMLNPIQAVRSLGLYAVIGIVILFILVMTLVPALILILPERRYRRELVGGAGEQGRLAKVLAALARFDIRQRRAIFVGAGLLVVAALMALPRIEADTNFLSYFPADSPIVRSHQAINDRVAGALPFYVVLGTPAHPGAMLTMEALRRIRDLEIFIDTIPGVTRSVSLTDYLDLLDRGLRSSGDVIVDDEGNPVDPGTIKSFWEDPRRLDEVLTFVKQNPSAFRSVISADFSQTNILVRTRFERSTEISAAVEQIRAFGEKNDPPDMQPMPTGNIVLLNGTTDDVVWGQVKSITVALVVIMIVMSLLFLSVKVGFITMLPNVVPIVLFFGILGWSHVTLNIGTSIIAAIALGIAVDNTIHFMVRFNRELQATYDQERSLTTALRTIGRPIVYTSAALTSGFLVMRLSEFVPVRDFGDLSAATMLAAMGTNLVLLPALLAQTRIVTLWDLLFVKLGKDPHKTIPLFRGLRRAQARIAVLLGTLQAVHAGETAVRQGEMGEAMYVIINGRADVIVISPDGQRRLVQRLDRGDVFGEMGLVRRQQRTADIVAVDDLELLAVDQRFLERLQRRYPRIAATVFLNLTRILSDKLESTTGRFAAAS
ncbi:MAG: MMPL family transporter [Deltaproteobacteria bacterium]|nr:MMPL family transporter [Deltaproteobacteria bacterium]